MAPLPEAQDLAQQRLWTLLDWLTQADADTVRRLAQLLALARAARREPADSPDAGERR